MISQVGISHVVDYDRLVSHVWNHLSCKWVYSPNDNTSRLLHRTDYKNEIMHVLEAKMEIVPKYSKNMIKNN